jgi:hypothetical protein
MPKQIRIVKAPPGEAPQEIREAWIGLVLPTNEQTMQIGDRQVGALGGKPQNLGGYKVDGATAITILGEANPEAAQWWHSNAPIALQNTLVFAKEVCEEVPD